MKSVKSLLGEIYHLGLKIDRKLKSPKRIRGAKVISVGNIAVGGRAKTPFVIFLARGLKERGFDPVVLTRGYGRKSSRPVIIDSHRQELDADTCGDEALEIWSRTEVTVLVGADRFQNARKFQHDHPSKKRVFILDDGFQHWSLKRDLDVVIVHAEDYHSRLLPMGRLREPVTALQRADVVLELGRDLHKLPQLGALPQSSRVEPALLLTTRAPDKAFEAVMSQHFQNIRIAALPDHARRERIWSELESADERQVVIGGKEAVKIVTNREQLEKLFSTGQTEIQVGSRSVQLTYVNLELKLDNADSFWQRVLKKIEPSKKSDLAR